MQQGPEPCYHQLHCTTCWTLKLQLNPDAAVNSETKVCDRLLVVTWGREVQQLEPLVEGEARLRLRINL